MSRGHAEAAAGDLGGAVQAPDERHDPMGGDVEALFKELGAEIVEREGSRVGVILFGEVRVFHRPHPTPEVDKGAVESIRKWLAGHGVRP